MTLSLLDMQKLGIIDAFPQLRGATEVTLYGQGHINETYKVTHGPSAKRYILQKINVAIFKEPQRLMQNIRSVTEYIRATSWIHGQETLNVVAIKEGAPLFIDIKKGVWRVYDFIENGLTPALDCSNEELLACGAAFGGFMKALDGFDATELFETIENFHHTPKRFDHFLKACEEDPLRRAEFARGEIDFAKTMAPYVDLLTQGLASGQIPLRVTHNDTKVTNVLIGNSPPHRAYVLDLDTVMPGSALYDYGDGIRSCISVAAEDEVDLTKVKLDFSRFSAFTQGFLSGSKGCLTSKEVELLPMGAILMTFECGIRFLTDYLEGDHYFRTHRPRQNLDRARTQLKLVQEMMFNIEHLKVLIGKLTEGKAVC